tara:strand:+ start:1617 stop:1829 length:213 start_codon:yes stop_codon:yes gene_type:complete
MLFNFFNKLYMDKIENPPLKPFVQELNNTLLKILCELRAIKIQQQNFINILNKKNIPNNEEVAKGWFWTN